MLPDELLVDVVRRLAGGGLQALALGLGRASRRLRAAAWHPCLYEEPIFSRDDSTRFIVAACERMGKHIRRLSFNGLARLHVIDDDTGAPPRRRLTEQDIMKCLEATPDLTHLSLAFLEDGNMPPSYYFQRLPPLPRLEHFNAAGVALANSALERLLASCAGTLRHLYLPSTTIRMYGSSSVGALDTIVRHRLPELLSLDLAEALVSRAALRALLAADSPAAPRLRHLFLVKARVKLAKRAACPALYSDSSSDSDSEDAEEDPGDSGPEPGPEDADSEARFPGVPSELRRVLKPIAPPELHVYAEDFDAEFPEVLAGGTGRTSAERLAQLDGLLERLPKHIACTGLDGSDIKGYTPFLKAVIWDRLEVARRLVERGASPLCHMLPTPFRRQPRPWDAPHPMRGSAYWNSEWPGMSALYFVPEMLHAGERVGAGAGAGQGEGWLDALRGWGLSALANARTFVRGESPLENALASDASSTREKSLQLLLALGADPTAVDGMGDTLAHGYARRGKDRALQTLLTARPDLAGITDAEGLTPLVRAAASGNGPAARVLLEAAGPAGRLHMLAAGRDGRTALHFAACEGLGAVYAELVARAGPEALEARDGKGRTPLLAAARRGDAAAVRALLERPQGQGQGAPVDVDAADPSGRTPLLEACRAAEPNAEIIRLLLAAGADPARRPPGPTRPSSSSSGPARSGAEGNGKDPAGHLSELLAACPEPALALAVPDPLGRTPLFLACRRGCFAAAAAVLPFSDPLAQDLEGNSCLHAGRFGAAGGFALVSDILRRCPAAALLRNAEGETPLHRLASRRPWRTAPAPPAPQGVLGESSDSDGPRPAPALAPTPAPRPEPTVECGEMGRAARGLLAASELAAQDAAGRTPIHAAVAAGRRVGVLLAAMLAAPQARAALALQDRTGSTLSTPLGARGAGAGAAGGGGPRGPGAPRDRHGCLPGEVGPERARRLVRRWLEGERAPEGGRARRHPIPRLYGSAQFPDPKPAEVASDSCPSDDAELL
eukprot:tig00000241_g20927.t1